MTPMVIYDADCRLCETGRQWIVRWAALSRRDDRPMRFLHFEEPEAVRLQPDLGGVGCLAAFRYLDDEGRAWEGEQAAIQVVRRLPGGRPVAWLLSLPGIYRLTQKSYHWIAAHRYRLFGPVARP
jgi:predicted DCC family thiol-disulfide oxidoreductase YuxK